MSLRSCISYASLWLIPLFSIFLPIISNAADPSATETKTPEPLAIGAKAPEIKAMDQNGKEVDFTEFYKKGYTLVYFYPKAGTEGCTAQACSLRDGYAKLTEKGIQVIGVSTDKAAAQKSFHEKNSLPFTLISDPERKVINAFGVPLGQKKPVALRQTFLIKNGAVIWRDLKPSPKNQAEDVLKALEIMTGPMNDLPPAAISNSPPQSTQGITK